MIFGTLNPKKIWHAMLQACPPHLSEEIQKVIFNSIIRS